MEQPERYRVHHAFIWLGGLRALFVTLWVIVVGAFSGLAALVAEITENPAFARDAGFVFALIVGGIIAVVLVIAALCFLLRWLQWRHLWYQFDPAEFSIYSGVISKKRTHVPYGRVQSVDQKATLIQRVLGLCAVSIDTAGGANNKAIVVPYVTKSQAEALRQQLYVQKAQLAAGAVAPVAAADGAVASGEAAPGASWAFCT